MQVDPSEMPSRECHELHDAFVSRRWSEELHGPMPFVALDDTHPIGARRNRDSDVIVAMDIDRDDVVVGSGVEQLDDSIGRCRHHPHARCGIVRVYGRVHRDASRGRKRQGCFPIGEPATAPRFPVHRIKEGGGGQQNDPLLHGVGTEPHLAALLIVEAPVGTIEPRGASETSHPAPPFAHIVPVIEAHGNPLVARFGGHSRSRRASRSAGARGACKRLPSGSSGCQGAEATGSRGRAHPSPSSVAPMA